MNDRTIDQLQAELDGLIRWFSSDDVSLDDAEVKYKRALEVANLIREKIEATENRITEIRQSFEDIE